jgi:hypothetical protein
MGPFTLYTPWWISGTTMDEPEKQIIVALIKAKDVGEVKEIIYTSMDEPEKQIIVALIKAKDGGGGERDHLHLLRQAAGQDRILFYQRGGAHMAAERSVPLGGLDDHLLEEARV